MKLLVALDGCQPSRRALDVAIRLAKSLPLSTIVLVNVRNAASIGVAEAGAMLPLAVEAEEEERAARVILGEAAACCRAAAVACTERAESGPIAETIVGIAREEQVDQIVMGTRGQGALSALLMGSTATQVLHSADRPVTLVK